MAKHLMRPIPKFEGLYSITEDGRVFSHGRVTRGGFRDEKIYKPQWILTHKNPKTGRLMAGLYSLEGKRYYYTVYKLVALAFIPNPHKKREVNHVDGNRENNHISNLEWATTEENKKHCKDNSLNKRGRYIK